MTISDGIGWQGGLTYGRSPAPAGIYDELKKLGVTHLAWESGHSNGLDSVAGDIGFFLFAVGHTKRMGTLSGLEFAEMPKQRPADNVFRNRALLLTCGEHSYQPGLYAVTELTVSVLSAQRPGSDYPGLQSI